MLFREVLGRYGWVSKEQWPPHSPDLNPLEYHVWNAIEEKVYEGRKKPFETTDQLQRRIKSAWDAAVNLGHLRKAIDEFSP